MIFRKPKALLFFVFLLLTLLSGWWVFESFVAKEGRNFNPDFSHYPRPLELAPDSSSNGLSVTGYRQIGREIQLLLYSQSENLAPFRLQIWQQGIEKYKGLVPKTPGIWLKFTPDSLDSGRITLHLSSSRDTTCQVTFELDYLTETADRIADSSLWFRQGSSDDWLDVRVVHKDGRYYLKDFADFRDGRSRTYLVEGMITPDLDKGIEVKPGFQYTVVARWVEKNLSQWWHRTRYRTSRLQSVYIRPETVSSDGGHSLLTPIGIPAWFLPSTDFNPQFDRQFPEFNAPAGKLVMMYRLNEDVPAAEYFKRGITHLPRWEEDVPGSRQHWTEAPGFFGDRDEAWFASLTKEEVEALADQVGEIGVYAFDFEFWNRRYSKPIRERLLWFARRLRENHPAMYLFDYWGGSAYVNTTFQSEDGVFNPGLFRRDYINPRSNHFNFEKTPGGDFFGNYFNITAVDVYPRPELLTGKSHFNLNNFLVLSAIHATRINRKISYQRDNKTIWYAWNRYMPLYNDPPFPWQVRTSSPAGSLVFQGLQTIPASQALALSLFSLVEGDGFYLWSDSQAWGRGENNYQINEDDVWQAPVEWWPDDGKASIREFQTIPGRSESPRYWDYPSDYFALGIWMAAQAGHILEVGERTDLAFRENGKWYEPREEQAVISAQELLPFVTAVVRGKEILVLALDSFQPANRTRQLKIRLPDGRETEIELYGNWPALYKGTLE